MKFRIHYKLPETVVFETVEDSVIVEGETIEEIREKANAEVLARGGFDPWSEEIAA